MKLVELTAWLVAAACTASWLILGLVGGVADVGTVIGVSQTVPELATVALLLLGASARPGGRSILFGLATIAALMRTPAFVVLAPEMISKTARDLGYEVAPYAVLCVSSLVVWRRSRSLPHAYPSQSDHTESALAACSDPLRLTKLRPEASQGAADESGVNAQQQNVHA